MPYFFFSFLLWLSPVTQASSFYTTTIESAEWRICPLLKNHSNEQNEIMCYAYAVSADPDFLYTLKSECGDISTTCKGATNDFGLCQLHYRYHRDFIDSPSFHDWRNQIDYCWEVYQKAEKRGVLKTTFYGYNVRQKVIHFFTWPKYILPTQSL